MSDQFWLMLSAVGVATLPVLIVQVFQWLTAKRNAKLSAAERAAIRAEVRSMKDHLTTQELKKKDIDRLVAGAERQGYVGGIEVGKRQATGPGGLTDFNPIGK